MKYTDVIKELKKQGSPQKAKVLGWFFKTKEGQYGYGDIFYGVTVPQQRILAKKYISLPFPDIAKLLAHNVHECRLTALLILVQKYQKAEKSEQKKIASFYIKNRKNINNWDLVDLSAPNILGTYLLTENRDILYKLAGSKNLWDRRIAIVSTYTFIKNNQFEDTARIAEVLLSDTHDLIHKACGWMLREVGKKSLPTEEAFLKKHAICMPRTMLRYAIEKFPEEKRKKYMHM